MWVQTGSFFFLFFPWVCMLCSLPLTTHMQPCMPLHPELEVPIPLQALTNTTLHTHHRIMPPQSHSCCYLYATLMPLCMPTLKPCTCTTHMRPVEVSVFVGARTSESAFLFFYFYFFFHFSFFFFSPVHLCTLSIHIWILSSCTPTLTWPEGKTAAPLQGLDDSNYLHPYHVHPLPMSHPQFQCGASSWHTTDYPLWPTNVS